MENAEIPQQEKQGIFETAHLKTITPKTPEEKEKVEEIKGKIIDIERYRGIIHYTQLPSLSNILLQGVQKGEVVHKNKKKAWGYGGQVGGVGIQFAVSVTRIGANSSFRRWENIPHEEAGPLLLLFDSN